MYTVAIYLQDCLYHTQWHNVSTLVYTHTISLSLLPNDLHFIRLLLVRDYMYLAFLNPLFAIFAVSLYL